MSAANFGNGDLASRADVNGPMILGHPTGLFTLFFAEMWERFSYYGMRALLVFYMIKGFLAYGDKQAYATYGAYTALVYATPFIGGMLADRLLGARKAVVLGGLLMAAGHLLMTIENQTAFFGALALLICGNGFFKPNISTIVGSLYPPGSPKRDSGFTIFYIGINLGAALAPLLCGYVGETFGWHYGFGLATIGMLIGVAIFVAPTLVTQGLIIAGALAVVAGMVWFGKDDKLMLAVNAPVGIALLVAAFISAAAVGKGGLPNGVGRPNPKSYTRGREMLVYVGVLIAVPIIAILVKRDALATIVLNVFGLLALGTIAFEAFRSPKVERERLFVVMVMFFFSMLFWAFFEQAGSSVNNFTDRNVDRTVATSTFTSAQVGQTVDVQANQAMVGLKRSDGTTVTLTDIEGVVNKVREADKEAGRITDARKVTMPWTVTTEHVGKEYNGTEVKATVFQAVNPICIMVFGLIFSALWGYLGRRKLEPSTPIKFAMGLLQLGLGFVVFWYAAKHANERGMTTMMLLVLGYVLHTTGELCLSPVGLSMVTRLSPQRIVSTVMGGWFLATAFSNLLAGKIASLTGVSHGEEGSGALPPPQETVNVYGDVFGKIGVAACIAAVVLLVLSPLLTKWMHRELEGKDEPPAGGGH